MRRFPLLFAARCDPLGRRWKEPEHSVEIYSVLTSNSGATNRANLQTALNACAGKRPLVAPGKDYPFASAGLSIPSNTWFRGIGAASILSWSSALTSGARYIASGDTVGGITGAALTGFRLNGGHDGSCWGDTPTYGDPAHGIFIDNVNRLWVQGVHVYRVPGIAIAAQAFQNANIIGNTTEENGRDAITLWVKNKVGDNANIANNQVIKPGDDAFAINNTGSEGTSCTVSNTGATVTVNSGTAPTSSNIGDLVVIATADGGKTYEGSIASVNGSTFTVSPAPASNVSSKSCYFGFKRASNIRYSNNTLVARTGNDSKGLGRMMYFTGCQDVEWQGGSLNGSYYSGLLFGTNDVTSLIRSKRISVKNVPISNVGKYTGSASSTQKDCIRLAGADAVTLENIPITSDMVDNGTTQIAWNPVDSYAYTKTDVTFQNNPSYNTNEVYP